MSLTVQIPNVCEFMSRHLLDVFDTMLSMKAVMQPATPLPLMTDRVTGCVGFAGECVTGAVYVHFPTTLANEVAGTMLGLTPAELSEGDVNDVVGEASNMLTGGLKSWLCDAGAECAMSTPAIIRGASFAIEPVPDVAREWLVFDCGTNKVIVEIHIKLD